MTDDRAVSGALLVARLITALYLVELLLNWTRPKLTDDEPALTIFIEYPGGDSPITRMLALPRGVFWAVLAGIVVGTVLQIVATRYPPQSRTGLRLLWATIAVLLLPFATLAVWFVLVWPTAALICVPTTLAMLALLHGAQRFVRVPARMLWTAFGWGALVAWGFTRACSNLAAGTLNGYLGGGITDSLEGISGDPMTALRESMELRAELLDRILLHLTVVGQLAQAAGILLLLLLVQRRLRDTVTGVVLGAAVGLGYAFLESVVFVGIFGSLGFITGATTGFEYWIRQVVTLPAGTVAFGAVLGGSLGVAARLADRRDRILTGGAGLLAALGGAVATETVPSWLAGHLDDAVDRGSVLDTVLVSPGLLLLVQAPFLVLAVLLWRDGTRERAERARAALDAEVAAGALGAEDAQVLADPALRLWVTAGVARRHGRRAAWDLRRRHLAQLDRAARAAASTGDRREALS